MIITHYSLNSEFISFVAKCKNFGGTVFATEGKHGRADAFEIDQHTDFIALHQAIV